MNVAISITEGRTVRDLFYNGLLDYLSEGGFETIIVFTEACAVPEFVQQWRRPGLEFTPLYPCGSTMWRQRAFWLRRRLVRLKSKALLNAWLRWEQQRLYPARSEYREVLRDHNVALLLTTHAHLFREAELITAAHTLGIPTLGVVRSWDNVHKGIRSRPQQLAVWNEINRQELIELEGYATGNVEIVGPPQFDLYFDPGAIWPRAKLAAHLDLDPARPIILFATLGNFFPELDETCWMDVLLDLLAKDRLPGRPQILCRLHPWSRLEHFNRYAAHPDVRLSYVDRYLPSLQWYMTRDDVVLMANMLRHANLVITPGSTVVLEAAIFDRPTLVPIFHPYQPERASDYFNTWVLGKHFGRLAELDLVPLVRKASEFSRAIRRALGSPNWYGPQRAKIVRDYVRFTDGRSTSRLATLVLSLARQESGTPAGYQSRTQAQNSLIESVRVPFHNIHSRFRRSSLWSDRRRFRRSPGRPGVAPPNSPAR